MASDISVTERSRAERAVARVPTGATVGVAVGGAATVFAAFVLQNQLALGNPVVWRAAVAVLGGGGLLLVFTSQHLQSRAFGVANGITLARGALTLLLAALIGVDAGDAIGWLVVTIAVIVVALDGVDGWFARNRNEASAFGARFDMETDALLILVLAALAWQFGKAGVWILAAGLLRYAFVLASFPLRWMERALPPSRRRQAVCVLQIVALIGALVPGVPAAWSSGIALASLMVLAWSFAIDTVWLARRAHV
ncbi:MAG: CDP-alcohol phosphatidyltransferase family protein [Gammaproteobacteria bacterium]